MEAPGDCENIVFTDQPVKNKADEDYNFIFRASIGASLYPEYGRFDNVVITYDDGLPDDDDDDEIDDDDQGDNNDDDDDDDDGCCG